MRLAYIVTLLGQAQANPSVDLVKLAAASLELAQYGGKALLDAMTNDNFSIKSKESFGHREVVTSADIESNKRVSFAYPVYFPGVHVRSEEVTDKPVELLKLPTTQDEWNNHTYYRQLRGTLYNEKLIVPAANVTIWIDPLDATREYTEGLYQYVTNMIGIAVNGRPVIGILNAPFQNRTKLGLQFGSISLNLDIGDGEVESSDKNVYVSRSYWLRLSGGGRRELQDAFEQDIIPAGGAGYKAWRVIEETNSAYIHTRRIKLWDLCAPEAVLLASGGRLTQFNGSAINYGPHESALHTGGVVATTNPAIHKMILDLSEELIAIK